MAGKAAGLCICALAVTLLVAASPGAARAPADHASIALNILPPGESGTGGKHQTDQLKLYDALTPRRGNVAPEDAARALQAGRRSWRGRQDEAGGDTARRPEDPARLVGRGARLRQDRVRRDVGRRLGRRGGPRIDPAADPRAGPDRRHRRAGVRPVARVRTELADRGRAGARVHALPRAERQAAAEGRRLVHRGDQLRYIKANGADYPPWTRNDVVAIGRADRRRVRQRRRRRGAPRAAAVGAQDRLGQTKGEQVWNDLREEQDPRRRSRSTAASASRHPTRTQKGNAIIDAAASTPPRAPARPPRRRQPSSRATRCSSARKRSATGHPLFVAGPQVGYFYPELLLEVDLHGGGIDARGATFPGVGPYVQLGRGTDFAWSATSAGIDIIDKFVESSGGDDTHYLLQGRVPRDDARSTPALVRRRRRHARWSLQRDRARPGDRLRDGRRRARGDLVDALDPRPRGRQRARVRRPEHERPDRRAELLRRRCRDRVHVQLVLRRQRRHRDVLERPDAGPPPAASTSACRRSGTGKYEWRGFLAAERAPAGDRPAERRDRQLEQQAGARAGRPRTTTGATARCTAAQLLAATRSTAQRRTRWRPWSAR